MNANTMRAIPAPARWKHPCANTEISLHQLAPYIGKLKSSIAGELIQSYSRKGDLVVDPFAGAGTIPFEAVSRGRRAFAADISPYSAVLTRGKLLAPATRDDALEAAAVVFRKVKRLSAPDLRTVPGWVRRFFHPETLREALTFAAIARKPGHEFLMSCFLGILHHQRPGFLSFPSSHLVPYLRDRQYPKSKFPEMYEYRDLRSRLEAKIVRCYRRVGDAAATESSFVHQQVADLHFPRSFDALITSPPYMNALDYGRDNRLRLWFIDPTANHIVDNGVTQRRAAFMEAMTKVASRAEAGLRPSGFCVLVVGESLQRTFSTHPADVVEDIVLEHAPSLTLRKVIVDRIPDVRRTRRDYQGVKRERILVFKRGRRR